MSEQSTEIDYTPGTVVRYAPDPSRHDPMWCREGLAIAEKRRHDGRVVLADTYWGSGSETHIVRDDEMASIEVLFHLDDYEELDRWRPDVQRWKTYAPEDRQRITMQHGLQQRLFIRKGAQPDMPTQIANAEEKVREAERAVESAEWRLEWARKDLAALVTSPGKRGNDD